MPRGLKEIVVILVQLNKDVWERQESLGQKDHLVQIRLAPQVPQVPQANKV